MPGASTFACLQTSGKPLPAELWAPQTPKLGVSGTPKGGWQPASPRQAQAASQPGCNRDLGIFFAMTNKQHQAVPPFHPHQEGSMGCSATLHWASCSPPCVCPPSPPGSKLQEERKNWAMWEKEGCASSSPLLAGRAGAGAAPPTSWAQCSGLQAKSSWLLPVSAPSTRLALGATSHKQYCSHPNTQYCSPSACPIGAAGCIPKLTPSAADNRTGQRRGAQPPQMPQHLVHRICVRAERAAAAPISYTACPVSQAGTVFPPSVGLET